MLRVIGTLVLLFPILEFSYDRQSFKTATKKDIKGTLIGSNISYYVVSALLVTVAIILTCQYSNRQESIKLQEPMYELKQIQLKAYGDLDPSEDNRLGCDRNEACLAAVKDELYTYISNNRQLQVNSDEINNYKQEQLRLEAEAIAAQEQAIKDAIELLNTSSLMTGDCLNESGVAYK